VRWLPVAAGPVGEHRLRLTVGVDNELTNATIPPGTITVGMDGFDRGDGRSSCSELLVRKSRVHFIDTRAAWI
jgi:hypothetical protein